LAKISERIEEKRVATRRIRERDKIHCRRSGVAIVRRHCSAARTMAIRVRDSRERERERAIISARCLRAASLSLSLSPRRVAPLSSKYFPRFSTIIGDERTSSWRPGLISHVDKTRRMRPRIFFLLPGLKTQTTDL